MNILFCYGNWMNPNRGGVQRTTDTLAKYFISKGHIIYYLTSQFDENDNYQFPSKIYHLPNSDFFSSVNLEYYHTLLTQLSISIVINHDSSNNRSKLWLNTGKQNTAKKISIYHTNPLYGLNIITQSPGHLRVFVSKYVPGLIYFFKLLRKKKEITYLLKNSDSLVLLSEEFKKKIFKELRISSSKIVAINNPCCISNNFGSENKKKQVIFVARMELSVKRPDKMLQIWAQLQDKNPEWILLILGDGPDRNKVEDLAESLRLKRVRFEGFVDPVPYYRESSIICMTSDYEGFGLVLIEAMEFGNVPITFNNWISLKDIILDQETGILVETNNMEDYVIKLDLLMSDDLLRKKISFNAKEHAKKFEIEKIGPEWIRLFNNLFS
jgi:glycosyltransferase involved in cell wall biosynthesis